MQASLEACERYQKQSYRNRCYILGPQGVQMLQVPVVHGSSWAITDVLVDYSTPWVVRTERALDTAYESAAFYEYFRDEIFSILKSKPEHLWDLNLQLIGWCIRRLRIDCELVPTTEFALPDTKADDYPLQSTPSILTQFYRTLDLRSHTTRCSVTVWEVSPSAFQSLIYSSTRVRTR